MAACTYWDSSSLFFVSDSKVANNWIGNILEAGFDNSVKCKVAAFTIAGLIVTAVELAKNHTTNLVKEPSIN